MPDLSLKLSDLYVAVHGPHGSGLGPFNTLQDRPGIPGIATYVLAKLRRKAVAELADLEPARLKLCEELAAKDDEGKPKLLPSGGFDIPDMAVFAERFTALMEQTVTLTGVRKLRVSEFGGANLTVGEWDALAVFVEDDDEKAA